MPRFCIGVIQLTMEPLEEILEHAPGVDEGGFDTIWLAEAYPWWRKHSMEARSSTALSAVMARATERLTSAGGSSPRSRATPCNGHGRPCRRSPGAALHPGLGMSKIFLQQRAHGVEAGRGDEDAAEIVQGVLAGEALRFEGEIFRAHVPALRDDAEAPREVLPSTWPRPAEDAARLAQEIADGLLTPSITTPAFVRYTRGQLRTRGATRFLDIGCTIVASIDDPRRGRDGAREIAGMYLANKVQNIRGAADTLLESRG